MAFRPVHGVTELVIRGEANGSERINTFYFKNEMGTPSAAQLNQLCLEFFTDVIAFYLACLSTNYRLVSIDARDISLPLGAEGHYIPSTTMFGAISSNPEASAVAALLTRETAFTGHSNVGRVYLPEVPANSAVKDVLSSAIVTLLTNLAVRLLHKYVGNLFTPVVASREHDTFNVIHDWVVRSIIGSQRRRKTGVGS